MAEVRFYHLERQGLAEALPGLVSRVLEAGLRAVIKCKDEDQVKALDKALWNWQPDAFLAHDVSGCKQPKAQPVYLTTRDENPAGASVLVLVDNAACDDPSSWDRCLYMFDGRSEEIVSTARDDWKKFSGSGIEMSYWQQRPEGGWEQKA